MDLRKLADVGTGMTFKIHLPIHIPSLRHLKLKEREKEMITTPTMKNLQNERKPPITNRKTNFHFSLKLSFSSFSSFKNPPPLNYFSHFLYQKKKAFNISFLPNKIIIKSIHFLTPQVPERSEGTR